LARREPHDLVSSHVVPVHDLRRQEKTKRSAKFNISRSWREIETHDIVTSCLVGGKRDERKKNGQPRIAPDRPTRRSRETSREEVDEPARFISIDALQTSEKTMRSSVKASGDEDEGKEGRE